MNILSETFKTTSSAEDARPRKFQPQLPDKRQSSNQLNTGSQKRKCWEIFLTGTFSVLSITTKQMQILHVATKMQPQDTSVSTSIAGMQATMMACPFLLLGLALVCPSMYLRPQVKPHGQLQPSHLPVPELVPHRHDKLEPLLTQEQPDCRRQTSAQKHRPAHLNSMNKQSFKNVRKDDQMKNQKPGRIMDIKYH